MPDSRTLETEFKKIERCQLIILDDLFIVPLDAKERPILLDIIEDRHERISIIITSQYPSSNWYDMVGDPTIADAILDRIIGSDESVLLFEKESKNLNSGYSASMTDIEIPMPKSSPSVCFCQNRIIHYHSAECQITYITDSPH